MSWRDTIQEENNPAPAPGGDAASWRDSIKEDETLPFAGEFKQGLSDAGDLLSNSAKFVTGNDLPKEPTPMQDVLKTKHQAGTAERLDYERAFLEGAGQSPGGKLIGAIGGVLPEANVVNTALGRWVNPAIEKKTGIDPTDLQLSEMAALPAVAGAVRSPNVGEFVKNEYGVQRPPRGDSIISNLPSVRALDKMTGDTGNPMTALRNAVKTATSPIHSPVQTTANVIRLGLMPLKAAAGPLVRGMINADNPFTGGEGLESALKSPASLEGQRLSDKLGINMSAGELTGNKYATGLEDTLANSGRYGERFAAANKEKMDSVIRKFNDTLDSVYGQETLPENFGRRLSASYNGTLDSLNKTTREQAKIDFNTAYEGADEAGKYIQSNNIFRTLQELRDEGNARLLTSSKALGGKIGRSLLNKLAVITPKGNEMADQITLKELGNGLSDFGEAAGDKNTPDAERRVYARLFDAAQKDLEAEITKPNANPEKTAMLAVARDNYFTNRNKIADLQKTTLGNMIGYADHNSQGQLTTAPESIAAKFATLRPSELKTTMEFLDKNHPDVADMGRRYVLEQALRKATEGAGLRGVGTTKPFAKAEFVKNLPDSEHLQILFGGKPALNDIMDVAAATNRFIDWGASKGGSQTAQRTGIFNALMHGGKGLLVKSIVSDNLVNDLLDPLKRQRMATEASKYDKFFDTVKQKGKEFYNNEEGALKAFYLPTESGGKTEVLQNPTHSELIKLAREDGYGVKTIKNEKGIFAWKGGDDLHHGDVDSHTNPEGGEEDYQAGTFNLEKGKLVSTYKDEPDVAPEVGEYNHNLKDFIFKKGKAFWEDQSGMADMLNFPRMKAGLENMKNKLPSSGPRRGVFDMNDLREKVAQNKLKLDPVERDKNLIVETIQAFGLTPDKARDYIKTTSYKGPIEELLNEAYSSERGVDRTTRAAEELRRTGKYYNDMVNKHGMLHPETKKAGDAFNAANNQVLALKRRKAQNQVDYSNPFINKEESSFPMTPASTEGRLEWLKTHIHPDIIRDWTDGGKNPLHRMPPEDIDMLYEGSQPTMKDLQDKPKSATSGPGYYPSRSPAIEKKLFELDNMEDPSIIDHWEKKLGKNLYGWTNAQIKEVHDINFKDKPHLNAPGRALASYTDKDGYTVSIINGVPESETYPPTSKLKRYGQKLIADPQGVTVKGGYWMNWPEKEWNISDADWKKMPLKDRAKMEAKHQATAYKSLKDQHKFFQNLQNEPDKK